MEQQLKDTLASIILRVVPDAPEHASQVSELLADGLTRYLIYARRPHDLQEEDLRLMIESLEFWAGMHGYPKRTRPVRFGVATAIIGSNLPDRKPVRKHKGPAALFLTAAAEK